MSVDNESRYLAPGVSKREAWSWAMFDFANSGYTTVVITAIFNAYFVAVVTNNQDWGTFAWTASLAASYALIMVAAPLVGAYADAYAAKKTVAAAVYGGLHFVYSVALFYRPRRSLVSSCANCSIQFFFSAAVKI